MVVVRNAGYAMMARWHLLKFQFAQIDNATYNSRCRPYRTSEELGSPSVQVSRDAEATCMAVTMIMTHQLTPQSSLLKGWSTNEGTPK